MHRTGARWVLAAAILAGPVLADTLTFQQGVNGYSGAVDTYIDASLSSQATAVLIVIDGSPEEHVLIRFDAIFGSGTGQIPVGSTINSATLTMRVGSATNDPSNNAVNFHRLLHAWVDTDLWAAYGVAPWNAQGGIQADGIDAVATAEATVTMSSASTAYTVTVTGSVQAWASVPATNYGWAILPTGTDGLRLESSESTTASYRPLLTVDFTPPGCDDNDDCGDGNPCTDDACVSNLCQHTNNSAACDDGDLCTENDVCENGGCGGTPKSCPPGSSCDPNTGQCLAISQTVTFQQGTGGYTGAKDTYLHAGSPDANNAAATTLVVDGPTSGAPGDERQVLMRFDGLFASAGGPIPDGVQITSATMTINVTNASADGAELHRMLVDWADTATWNSMSGGVQTDGVEALAAVDASSFLNSTGLHTLDVTPSVAAWAAGATNRGWVWVTPAGGTDSWQFDSAEGATVASRPKLTVTYTMAGPSVTMVAPPDGATGVSARPDLTVTVEDPQDDPLDVTFYGREAGGTPPTDFMIVHVTDTQFAAESNPAVYRAQMQWVHDNQAARNIVHLIHTGDITNVAGSETQWINADSAMDLLEVPLPGLPHGVPYAVLPGNHDGAPGGTLLYNQYFGVSRFLGRAYYGGHYGSNNDNNYTLFSAGGMDFIAVQLNMQPDSAVLAWADGLLQTYSNRRAIVSSHYIMEVGENAPFSSWGSSIYNTLKDNPNLFLMLCGHMHGEGKRYDDFEGRRVWTLIADYQEVQSGHSGYMRLLTFSPANDKIYVQTFSPTANGGAGGYLTGSTSEFVLDYQMEGSGPFTRIGAVADVPSGGTATLPWPGRMAGKRYEWYVEATDGASTVTGPTWSFTSDGDCTADSDCDDGLFCNGVEDCPEGGGTCTAGTSPCSAGQVCNEVTDQCAACVTDGDCNDSDPCTTDRCVSGLCENTEVDCSALDDQCNIGVCDALLGACVAQPRANGTPCSDGLSCTINDACVGGVCVGTDDCPGEQVCNPATNACTMPTPTVVFQDGQSGYAGTVDTYLRQQAASTAHGTLDWIEWDSDEGGSGQETMALLRFGNIIGDAFGQVPPNSEILSATLRVYVFDTGNNGSVRHALVAWDESTTYNNFGGEPGAQGDEYGPEVASIPGGSGYQTVDVTASVQAWADDPGSNLGWLILHTGSAGTGIRSREAATAAERPMLTVTFRVQCETNADCDDANPCTTDTCNGNGECAYTNNTNACDDGNPCTTNDTCSGGNCAGTPVDCGPGYSCDQATGNCVLTPTAEPLPIDPNDTWRYFKGTTAPPANWTALAFDDSGWLAGPGGFGYGSDCTAQRGTTLSDMQNGYVSVYFRRLFHIDDPDVISRLTLTVDYDDAFVAYINGVEVARRNITGTPPSYTQLATVDHECSACTSTTCNAAESIDLTESVDILTDNANVLAIQAHNLTAGSSDFTLIVSLVATLAPNCQYNSDCDDGNVCNGLETCVSGQCVAGTPLVCDDGNPCTTDSCNALTGCVATPVANGTPCADADVCDGAETCQNGVCQDGAPLDCDDGLACTLDTCDSQSGCVHTDNCPAGQSCNHTTGNCDAPSLPIGVGATWRYFKGSAEPPAGWAAITFDDSGWLSGPSGFGYGTDCAAQRGTLLSDMRQTTTPPNPGYMSVYLRRLFHVANPARVTSLTLTADYDDGFVVYVNGVEVPGARRNVVGTPPAYNQAATADHECSACDGTTCNPAEVISLDAAIAQLVAGTNVIAIQAHNYSLTSSDFTMLPTVASTESQGCTSDAECDDGNPCTDDVCNVGTGVCTNTADDSNLCSDGIPCTSDACVSGACVSTDACPPGESCNHTTGTCEATPQVRTFRNGVASYAGTQDTYLMQYEPATAHGDQTAFEWDLEDPAGYQNVGLLRFDGLFGPNPDQIPPGAQIASAVLTIVVFDESVAPAGEIHLALVDWDESVTWNNFGGEAGVQADEYDPQLVASAPIAVGTHNIDVTSSLQAWSAAPAGNRGWIFLPLSTNGVQVRSSEYATVAERPMLTVTFEPPPPECDDNADCDDGDVCNGAETCVSGDCVAGTPLNCNDGVTCTTDTCDAQLGCQHVDNCPTGSHCNTSSNQCEADVVAEMTCELASASAAPGQTVELYTFVADALNVRSYQTTIVVTRLSGGGSLTVDCPGGVLVEDTRTDYIFYGAANDWPAVNCGLLRASSTLQTGSVTVGATPKYLSTYRLHVSADATPGSTFQIVLAPPTASALYDNTPGNPQPIPFTIGPACVLEVEAGGDCYIGGQWYTAGTVNPANGCTECNPALSTTSWSPRPAGTACGGGGGGACDLPDTCDGAGTCVDRLADAGTTCRPAAGPCDIAEACSGSSAECPPDAFAPSSTVCREAAHACDATEYCTGSDAACPADADAPDGTACNDQLYCTATDVCEDGACVGGNPRCTGACERCNELIDACEHCRYDIYTADGGVIGGGDFVIFASFYGACYSPGDPALIADFNRNNCVDGGDFAIFSPCYATMCGACATCYGTLREADTDAGVTSIRVVAVPRPSASDTADEPPVSLRSVAPGAAFTIEVWASHSSTTGLAATYVDVQLDPARVALLHIVPGGAFSNLTHGVVYPERGLIAALGGCAQPGEGDVASGGTWACVARLAVRALEADQPAGAGPLGGSGGATVVRTGPAAMPFGVAMFGHAEYERAKKIEFGGLKLRITAPDAAPNGRE